LPSKGNFQTFQYFTCIQLYALHRAQQSRQRRPRKRQAQNGWQFNDLKRFLRQVNARQSPIR
jgi:hypothetical protein